jgi:hypothetical protein
VLQEFLTKLTEQFRCDEILLLAEERLAQQERELAELKQRALATGGPMKKGSSPVPNLARHLRDVRCPDNRYEERVCGA